MVVIASLVGVVAIAVATTLVSGFDNLGVRYATVTFKADTSDAAKADVLRDCAAPPAVRAQPISDNPAAKDKGKDAKFRVDKADNGQIAELSRCLKEHDSVLGIQISDLTVG